MAVHRYEIQLVVSKTVTVETQDSDPESGNAKLVEAVEKLKLRFEGNGVVEKWVIMAERHYA